MSKPVVLVVDDEPAIRQVLSAALNKAGYPVESAGSAAEALAKLDKTAFDVVLCDVFMPVTDGIEHSVDAFLDMLQGGNVGKALVRLDTTWQV